MMNSCAAPPSQPPRSLFPCAYHDGFLSILFSHTCVSGRFLKPRYRTPHLFLWIITIQEQCAVSNCTFEATKGTVRHIYYQSNNSAVSNCTFEQNENYVGASWTSYFILERVRIMKLWTIIQNFLQPMLLFQYSLSWIHHVLIPREFHQTLFSFSGFD
jgi:hypothetical protein